MSVGPDQNAPQFTIENSYQVVDQATYNLGRHSLKFGVDWRNIISPQSFVQRAFNHPQYVPGSVDGVEPIATTGVAQINTVGQADFNVPSHVFSSHPRVIQLALRFDF